MQSPSRPPGFSDSPRYRSSPPASRTPTFIPSSPASEDANAAGLSKLFAAVASPLLQLPSTSPQPVRPTTRRKTLAIHLTGFSKRRSSTRIRDKRKAKPVVQEAEAFVCRNLGIIQDGEVVTEQALSSFVKMFKDQVSAEAVRALRTMFKLDEDNTIAVERAMMLRGGAAALEQFDSDLGLNIANA